MNKYFKEVKFIKVKVILFIMFFSIVLMLRIFSKNSNNNPTITLYIIGDSLASDYDKERYPRTGWGQVLQNFFNKKNMAISNHATSGRSSKGFFDEKRWETITGILKKVDYVFIQFGHNDQKNDSRHTDPQTTYKEYLTKYITDTREKGAFPVLLTSIHRNEWYQDKIIDTLGDYPVAMRELAKELKVPLIDLHKLSKELFEKKGKENMNKVFLILKPGEYKNYPNGKQDNTHLQESGAIEICNLIANEIIKQNIEIKQFLIKK